MEWNVTKSSKNIPKIKDPILIVGLPGIGNVGKVAVDFIIEELGAKKVYDFFSYTFPHSVFVNEDNLINLPQIGMYYKKVKGKHDLLLLAGDVQPTDEVSSYKFCDEIIKIFKKHKGKEIITLGGIGLSKVPKKPGVYCTGNSKKIIDKYKKNTKMNSNLYGVVGPIMGTTGLLLGISQKHNIKSVSFLAETYGHPLYLGIKGSKEIVKVIDKKLGLKINIKELEKEINDAEKEMMKVTKGLKDVSENTALKKVKDKFNPKNYIG